MNNPMQQIAELKAQLKAVTAERDNLRERHGTTPNADELGSAIGVHLMSIEENLRRDFTDKFAGNFLRATDAMTNRVTALETRQSQLEAHHAKLEERAAKHIEDVGALLDGASQKQSAMLTKFDSVLQQHHTKNDTALTRLRAGVEKCSIAVQKCEAAAAVTSKAAASCATFAQDYEAVATRASQVMGIYERTAEGSLKASIDQIARSAHDAMMPVIKGVGQLAYSQYRRRAFLMALGVPLGIALASYAAWVSQPSTSVMKDAVAWRSLTTALTPPQHEKVMRLVDEIQRENRVEKEKRSR